MIAINQTSSLYDPDFSGTLPSGWQIVSAETFNALRLAGFNPTLRHVADSVGHAQFRTAARQLQGITDGNINSWVAQIVDQTAKAAAQDYWGHTGRIWRSDAQATAFAANFGLTSAQMDDIFVLAASLGGG